MTDAPIISVNVGSIPLTGSILSGNADPVLDRISSLSVDLDSLSSNLDDVKTTLSGEAPFVMDCTEW